MVGLKCGSEKRRRLFRVPVGAALTAARSWTERRVLEAAPYKKWRSLKGGGGKPPPYKGGSIQSRRISFRAGGHIGPPLQRKQTGSLARQSQAQKMNRNGGNFCKLRAQWPGMKR